MARILFSFLGAAYYSLETYSFGSNPAARHETKFFPQALIAEQTRLRARNAFDKVVLCGTTTSGWHAVASALGADIPPVDPARGNPPALSTSEIASFSEPLSRALGANVIAQEIGFARDTADQMTFLQMVANHVVRHDLVQFDITHGFRHQPVIALIAAFAVQRLRDAKVEAIWYGAVQMKENALSPVVRLDGLLSVLDWFDALSIFDATGDMARFGPLIDREALTEISRPLAEASFQERILQTKSIRRVAGTVLDTLSEKSDWPGHRKRNASMKGSIWR
jgi:CRISPR-associated Csx2 family protein